MIRPSSSPTISRSQQVFTALANGNGNAGGSYVEHGSELYVVRGLGFVRDIADIGAIAVDTRGGTPIRISDIGTVIIGHAVRLGRVGMLFKTPEGGSEDEDACPKASSSCAAARTRWKSADGIEKMAGEINDRYLPPGVRLVTYYDRTELIRAHAAHRAAQT